MVVQSRPVMERARVVGGGITQARTNDGAFIQKYSVSPSLEE